MYRLTAAVRLRTIETDGSHWAFNLESGSHYELNETAYRILRGIKDRLTTEEIAVELASEFGIPVRQAESDVNEALVVFARNGLGTMEETS